MPSFNKGPDLRTPFGKNVFLRSTQDVKTESYTVADGTVTSQTIDGATGQVILQTGTVMAKITSGGDSGKIGPYQPGNPVAAVDEIQTLTVDATSGNFTVSFDGETTASIAFDATAGAVTTALEGLSNVGSGDIVATGGPGDSGGTTPYTLTFGGQYAATDVPLATAADVDLAGGGDTVAITLDTAGSAAASDTPATDGRQTATNIVGLNNTFLPWQLTERDVEISVVYECTAVQAWCLEYDNARAEIELTDATADLMRGTKGLDILFK